MTKDKDRDDELIAEAAEMFPPDTVDVQSRYVIVHQLRASADIQDAQTKRETGWADTSDRACLMRKAADALDAMLAKLQPAPKPDRAKALAWMIEGLFAEAADNPCTCASDENSCPHCNAWERATKQTRACIVEAIDELRAEWEAERPIDSGMSGDAVKDAEWLWVNLPTRIKWTSLETHEKALVCHTVARLRAERPAVVVPDDVRAWALQWSDSKSKAGVVSRFILSLDGAKGGE